MSYRHHGIAVRLSARLDPFGLMITRAAGLGDVRKIGSGNIGATNVLRTGNKDLAAATLLLDALKGTAAVLIAALLRRTDLAASLAGFGAFLGHLFPVWLGFKGGKGVATYIGVLLGVAPACGAGLRRRLAGGRLPHPLLLAGGAGGRGRRAGCAVFTGLRQGCRCVRGHDPRSSS